MEETKSNHPTADETGGEKGERTPTKEEKENVEGEEIKNPPPRPKKQMTAKQLKVLRAGRMLRWAKKKSKEAKLEEEEEKKEKRSSVQSDASDDEQLVQRKKKAKKERVVESSSSEEEETDSSEEETSSSSEEDSESSSDSSDSDAPPPQPPLSKRKIGRKVDRYVSKLFDKQQLKNKKREYRSRSEEEVYQPPLFNFL
mmetsp:Transcript_55784/g.81530  ORF Transcript_55784/g.81530 Transcript_55784/m.81530 type:complete len:199 (-) Transcript_55784:31-627(-)